MRQIVGQIELFVSDHPKAYYNNHIETVGNRCLLLCNKDDAVVVVLTDTDAMVLMEVLADLDSVRGRYIQYGNLVIDHIDSDGWVGLSITVEGVCSYISSKYIPQLHALLVDNSNVTTHDYR